MVNIETRKQITETLKTYSINQLDDLIKRCSEKLDRCIQTNNAYWADIYLATAEEAEAQLEIRMKQEFQSALATHYWNKP